MHSQVSAPFSGLPAHHNMSGTIQQCFKPSGHIQAQEHSTQQQEDEAGGSDDLMFTGLFFRRRIAEKYRKKGVRNTRKNNARSIAKAMPENRRLSSKIALRMLISLEKIPNGGVPAMASSPSKNTVPETGNSRSTPDTASICLDRYRCIRLPDARNNMDFVMEWLMI
jgi:hypothetical protein